jgi:glutaredoxin
MKLFYTQILLLFFVGILAINCESKKKSIDTTGNLTPKVDKTIIIYGSQSCDHCITFRQKIDSLNIKYDFRDAEANENYYNELMFKIQQARYTDYIAFPVVDIEGKLMVRPELDVFLKEYQK